MPDDDTPIILPSTAEDAPGSTQAGEATIRNPVADKATLTRAEAFRLIAYLGAYFEAEASRRGIVRNEDGG